MSVTLAGELPPPSFIRFDLPLGRVWFRYSPSLLP
jgi:hypothetical protein